MVVGGGGGGGGGGQRNSVFKIIGVGWFRILGGGARLRILGGGKGGPNFQ